MIIKVRRTLSALGLSFALAACTTQGTPGSGSSVGNGNGGTSTRQLTGAQLAHALLGTHGYPAGFRVEPKSEVDTGTALRPATAAAKVATADCTAVFASDMEEPGFGATAFAGEDVRNDALKLEMGQWIRQFATDTAASTFFGQLLQKVRSCGQSDAQTPLEGVGQNGFALGYSLTAEGKTVDTAMLYALDGTDVYLVAPTGYADDVNQLPDPQSTLRDLITNVAAMDGS